MIKLGPEYTFLRTCGRILEAGKQEYVLDAIGLSSPDSLRLLRAMAGKRENYEVAGTGRSRRRLIDKRIDARSALASINAVTS